MAEQLDQGGSIPRNWVEFTDWSDGEFGTMPPHLASEKAFTGSNVIRYENGLLGPRPGLKKHAITNNVNGFLWGFFSVGVASAGALVLIIGDKVYTTNNDSDFTLTLLGTLGGGQPAVQCAFTMYDPNTQVYVAVPGDAVYNINVTVPSLTNILNKGCLTCFLWKDRLYAMGDRATDPYTVFYTDAAAFGSWGTNFFNLGYHWEGYAFAAMGNNLYMGTRSEGWWALTGGSPSTGTLRQIYRDSAPGKQNEVVTENGLTWYWHETYDGITGIDLEGGVGKLANTNGSVFDADSFGHLELGGDRFGLYSKRRRNIIYVSSLNQGYLRNYGVWSALNFEVDLSGHVADTNMPDAAGPGLDVAVWSRMNVNLVAGSAATCSRQDFLESGTVSLTSASWIASRTCAGCGCGMAKKSGDPEGWDILDKEAVGETGTNMNVKEEEFPCDLFEYSFNVKGWMDGADPADDGIVPFPAGNDGFCESRMAKVAFDAPDGITYQLYPDEAFLYRYARKIKPTAGNAKYVRAEQLLSGNVSAADSGLVWCQADCVPQNGIVGSVLTPVALVVDPGTNAPFHAKLYGLLFFRSNGDGPLDAGTGGNASVEFNAQSLIYGSVLVHGPIGGGFGGGLVFGDVEILKALNKLPSMSRYDTLRGGWTDAFSY